MLKLVLLAMVAWAAWKLFAKPRSTSVSQVAPESMPRVQARQLLEVRPDADEQAIREAHRRKVAAVHPDRGGSDALTRELNAARDLLLATRR